MTTFLTRSLGLRTGELGPDGLGDILGHQGVLGLDLGEGLGHGHGWLVAGGGVAAERGLTQVRSAQSVGRAGGSSLVQFESVQK